MLLVVVLVVTESEFGRLLGDPVGIDVTGGRVCIFVGCGVGFSVGEELVGSRLGRSVELSGDGLLGKGVGIIVGAIVVGVIVSVSTAPLVGSSVGGILERVGVGLSVDIGTAVGIVVIVSLSPGIGTGTILPPRVL